MIWEIGDRKVFSTNFVWRRRECGKVTAKHNFLTLCPLNEAEIWLYLLPICLIRTLAYCGRWKQCHKYCGYFQCVIIFFQKISTLDNPNVNIRFFNRTYEYFEIYIYTILRNSFLCFYIFNYWRLKKLVNSFLRPRIKN